MKIVLIHYHLKPGGVNTVIRQQAEILQRRHDVLVLTGEPADKTFPVDWEWIPGLAYDKLQPEPAAPSSVVDNALQAIRRRWGRDCDLVHVHNPLLAKNRRFLEILSHFQQAGLKLFLQIHDFAEDGRPDVYYQSPYPVDCHYGVINSRDYRILLDSGLTEKGVHLLPNGVDTPPTAETAVGGGSGVLYPVRAIRRKNIGEAILLSVFFSGNEQLTITLPPNSPADIETYRAWKGLVAETGLPVRFEAGLTESYPELVRSSATLLTTSINEGFGFCFLEAWTWGKPLWGRLLPEICSDFQRHGLRLDHLYKGLSVPLAWVNRDRFASRWQSCWEQVQRRFQANQVPGADSAAALDRITADGRVDFGLLDEPLQRTVINTVLTHSGHRRQLVDRNPFLSHPGRIEGKRELIDHNRRVVDHYYHLDRYQERLQAIYQQVINQPVRQRIDRRRLLNHFLRPDRFSLLKWCRPNESRSSP